MIQKPGINSEWKKYAGEAFYYEIWKKKGKANSPTLFSTLDYTKAENVLKNLSTFLDPEDSSTLYIQKLPLPLKIVESWEADI